MFKNCLEEIVQSVEHMKLMKNSATMLETTRSIQQQTNNSMKLRNDQKITTLHLIQEMQGGYFSINTLLVSQHLFLACWLFTL